MVTAHPKSTSGVLVFLLVLLLGALSSRGLTGEAHAQPRADRQEGASPYANLIANVRGRDVTLLNGYWDAIVDPFEVGYYDHYLEPDSARGFFNDEKAQRPSDRVEYDFEADQRLYVPGEWNTQGEELFLYEGTVWYKRDFDYDLPPDRRLFVYFGAANYESKVWLNRKKLGEHEGGFTPFQFEITDRLRSEGNFLVAKIDNQRHRDAVPTVNADWWNYGGITRDVFLVEMPQTFIQDYRVQLAPDRPSHVSGWVQLDGPEAEGQRVRVSIPEIGVATTATTGSDGRAQFTFDADVERWSSQSPKRYRVVVETGDDRMEEQIGFRTIEARGTDILLNGEPIFLRGISLHESSPMEAGRAYSEEEARILLTWAKELGCNFVRLAHYPHNEHMVRLAEEMGLMVWSEVPVYWTINWENEGTLANAKRQLTEMITRDKNRASVILWSVANETPRTEARLAFLRSLIERARHLDGTRLITAALENHYIDEHTITIDDPLGEYLDVLGNNEYIGWYDGPPEKADTIQWQTPYDKPLVMSEFGGGALHGMHGSEDLRWSEEYQRSIYEHQIPMLEQISFLAGTTPWILKDFRSPRRPLARIQDYWNRKGLISNRGFKKEAFYVLQAWYRKIQQEGYGQAGEGARGR